MLIIYFVDWIVEYKTNNSIKILGFIKLDRTTILTHNTLLSIIKDKNTSIKLESSFFPDHLSQIILNLEEIKLFFVKNYSVSNDQDSITKKYSFFEFPGSLKEFSDLLNSLLQKKSINEYVVAQGMENENTPAVLKVGDI